MMLRKAETKIKRTASTIVEATFVLSALITFLFAIFEFGRYIMIRHLVDNATREGARLAVTANSDDTNSFNYQTSTTITNTVIAALSNQNVALTSLNVQVFDGDATGAQIGAWTNAQYGNNIVVSIDATYTPLFSKFGFLPSSLPVHMESVMHTEAN